MIFLLKMSGDSEWFISYAKMNHIFGDKKETVPVPNHTEFILCLVRTWYPRKLYMLFFSTKVSLIRGEESPCKNLYILVARILIFWWCIVIELFFSSNFWEDDDFSLFVILSALSWIRFILLLKPRVWNIQTNGQYLNSDSIKAFLKFFFYQCSWKIQGEQED